MQNTNQTVGSFIADLDDVLSNIRKLLMKKNESYGDSALNPIRIFSKSDSMEQLNVRIDDKLSRLASGLNYEGEDTISDLIGYLILYKIQQDRIVRGYKY
jgi:hypothetical protein